MNGHRRGFSQFHWGESSAVFLIYVAAVLRHEPIFAQPLDFIFGTAGAVEQLAMQGAVGVTDFWHTVLILKFCIVFFTGHQIKLIHDCIFLSVFMCQAHNALILSRTSSLYYWRLHQKAASIFRERVCIDTTQKRSERTCSLHRNGADQKGFGNFPTSILHRKIAFVRTKALLAATMRSFNLKPSSSNYFSIHTKKSFEHSSQTLKSCPPGS